LAVDKVIVKIIRLTFLAHSISGHGTTQSILWITPPAYFTKKDK